VADWVRVVPGDLHLSASKVADHADDLQVRHAAANARIEAAQAGVPAAAAVALDAAVAKWQTDTTVLFGNLMQHGELMHQVSVGYVATEESNTADIAAVGEQGTALDATL
jgi:hypothetical protein